MADDITSPLLDHDDADLIAQAIHGALCAPLTCLPADDYDRAASAVLAALVAADRLRRPTPGDVVIRHHYHAARGEWATAVAAQNADPRSIVIGLRVTLMQGMTAALGDLAHALGVDLSVVDAPEVGRPG